MATTTGPFRLRPGRPSDVAAAVTLYNTCFESDTLVKMLFPLRHQYPKDHFTYLYRHFQTRYWSLDWVLTMVDDEEGNAVGFAWWKKPADDIIFRERWFSPFAWFAPLMRTFIALKNLLFPTAIEINASEAFNSVFSLIKDSIINTERRRNAWYLSTLAVHPSTQGKGLGAWLVREGLREVDKGGKAAWLVSAKGKDGFYERLGFVEVGRANVGEMSEWDGGAVMFRE